MTSAAVKTPRERQAFNRILSRNLRNNILTKSNHAPMMRNKKNIGAEVRLRGPGRVLEVAEEEEVSDEVFRLLATALMVHLASGILVVDLVGRLRHEGGPEMTLLSAVVPA